jgi:phosphotransferase system  glucose/maltose/N-acetylglucosamine-specific IIC component
MRKLPIILFVIGTTIQLLALFGEHAVEIPFVIRNIAPAYAHASKGMATLVHGAHLKHGDEGFTEVAAVLLDNFKQKLNVSTKYTDLSIDDIWFDPTAMQAGESVDSFALVDFHVATVSTVIVGVGGHTGLMHLPNLKSAIDELKTPSLLRFCFGMFFIGVIIDAFAFFLESRESNEFGDHQKDKKNDETTKSSNEANQEHPSIKCD